MEDVLVSEVKGKFYCELKRKSFLDKDDKRWSIPFHLQQATDYILRTELSTDQPSENNVCNEYDGVYNK